MKNEDGINAGVRNVGRLWLATIPLVLGLAATTWFSLWMMGYGFQRQKEADKKQDEAAKHELTQQERSAVYVGASERPKGKLAVEIVAKSCVAIVRADIDTKKKGYPYDAADYQYSLILYGQNNCGKDLDYTAWNWEMVSPNGTVIKAGYSNNAHCPVPPQWSIAECVFLIDPDERADKFRVWAKVNVF